MALSRNRLEHGRSHSSARRGDRWTRLFATPSDRGL